MDPWHALSASAALARLATTEHGLSSADARERLHAYGRNVIPQTKPESVFALFARQFKSPLIYLLLAAGVAMLVLGQTKNALIVFFVLALNAVVGAFQEGRAQHTLRALKNLLTTNANVLRDGAETLVPDEEVVPGDLLVLSEGERVPADARLIRAHALKVEEAALTGESEPVAKRAESILHDAAPTTERKNMLFKGTYIVAGEAVALAVATGTHTIVGAIARDVATIDREMPLVDDLRVLSRGIIHTVLAGAALLVGIGFLSGYPFAAVFATVVSLVVSVVPEGLPVVLTIVLATGVWRMSRRGALVKRLPAVEALGETRILAVDKTGTLTRNELIVREVWVAGERYDADGAGYDPSGEIRHHGLTIAPPAHEPLLRAGRAAALAARAHVSYDAQEKRWKVHGDPTEAALVVFGAKVGFRKEEIAEEFPIISEVPFDHRLAYRAVVTKAGTTVLTIVIGAPEAILTLSERTGASAEESRELRAPERAELSGVMERMSERGLRVLAWGFREDASAPEGLPRALTLGGFFGIEDALRREVPDTVAAARDAGIRVVMITGDHALTARSIAREAGILREGDRTLSGKDLDAMSDAELARESPYVTVFSRVLPEQKLRIVRTYQARAERVAMTGDGVNDAPSLMAADLGIAMGSTGTEVAKEAADIVLTDDNFATIMSAVEEGRGMYRTMGKVILYLFSTSLGEALVIFGAMLFALPLPLLPAQILWLNLVTDGFLDVALAMEPKERGLLSAAFARRARSLMPKGSATRMGFMAAPMVIGTLALFAAYAPRDPVLASSVALTALAVFQWINAWNCRFETRSAFGRGALGNRYLLAATGIVVALQLFALYTPFLRPVLSTVPLSAADWLLILATASSVLFVEEVRKFFARRGAGASRAAGVAYTA